MHENGPAILYPMFALAALTTLVQWMIPIARVGAGARGELKVDDFRLGESAGVPERVRISNRNYMNLLEFPILLYIGCLIAYVATDVAPAMITLAWVFVGLRVLHSGIHLSYNRVPHRAFVFGAGNVVLVVLWVQIGLKFS
jgi:hypothetical protein